MKTYYIRFINHDIEKTGLYWIKTTSKRKAINSFKRDTSDYCEILEITEVRQSKCVFPWNGGKRNGR